MTTNSTIIFPTDTLGTTIFIIFFAIGFLVTLSSGVFLFLKAIEKIEGHFERLWNIEDRITKLEEKVISLTETDRS